MTLGQQTNDARVHGGMSHALLTRLGLEPKDILDLSVNVNPYGPAPAVLAAIRSAPFAAYPDPQAGALKEAIGLWANVDPATVVVGNGAADLMWTLVRALLPPGSKALIAEPTFCEFKAACRAGRVEVHSWRASPRDYFAFDLYALSQTIQEVKPKAVYLCNPNSPTGGYVPLAEVRALAARHPDVHIVLDEAFLSLSVHHQDLFATLPQNVMRLRSFTKEHTIAGLRIGYLLTTPSLARAVEEQRPAWTINSVAEAAACAALGVDAFVAASRERIFSDLKVMQQALRGLGLLPLPTTTLYFLLPMPKGVPWREVLLGHRILVRDCASYGLNDYLRLCSRPAMDVARLITALEKEMRNL